MYNNHKRGSCLLQKVDFKKCRKNTSRKRWRELCVAKSGSLLAWLRAHLTRCWEETAFILFLSSSLQSQSNYLRRKNNSIFSSCSSVSPSRSPSNPPRDLLKRKKWRCPLFRPKKWLEKCINRDKKISQQKSVIHRLLLKGLHVWQCRWLRQPTLPKTTTHTHLHYSSFSSSHISRVVALGSAQLHTGEREVALKTTSNW